MVIHSFYKSLLSIYKVIGNSAEHCGTTVSKVEIFSSVRAYSLVQSFQTCAETQNDEPGDADLFCPLSNWAGPKRAGKNFVQLPLTVSSPVWCSSEQGSD